MHNRHRAWFTTYGTFVNVLSVVLLVSLQEAYTSLVEYFGENPKTTQPSMFFPMFGRFIKAYKVRICCGIKKYIYYLWSAAFKWIYLLLILNADSAERTWAKKEEGGQWREGIISHKDTCTKGKQMLILFALCWFIFDEEKRRQGTGLNGGR